MKNLKNNYKTIFKISVFCIGLIVIAMSFSAIAYATAGSYQLLQPLPSPEGGGSVTEIGSSNFSSYLLWFFRFALAAAAFLAVLKITIAGIMIVYSGASEKAYGTAMGYINDALWGLALAFASYLILYTINPDLVEMKLDLQNAATSNATTTFQMTNTSSMAMVNGERRMYVWEEDRYDLGLGGCIAYDQGNLSQNPLRSAPEGDCTSKIGPKPIRRAYRHDYLCCYKVIIPAPAPVRAKQYKWVGPPSGCTGTPPAGYDAWHSVGQTPCLTAIGAPTNPSPPALETACCESVELALPPTP